MRPSTKRTAVRTPADSGRSWTRLWHFPFPSPFDSGKLGGSGREATATSSEFRNSSVSTTPTSPACVTRSARAAAGALKLNARTNNKRKAFIIRSEPAADDVVEAQEADRPALLVDDGEDCD